MATKVLIVHLLTCGVVSRTPVSPLARYRDVVTTQGIVRGYYAPHPPHYAYLGVPYARPPTRYDRFKAPKPAHPWSGIFEATHRVKCPQPDGSGDENCLVVNVFTPENATSLPVVVHFHDGGFQRGWGTVKVPSKLFERNLVIVSFNYRLGVLGFLCLRSEDAPGNAGVKDQVAALYWVHRNIAKFGGNPSDVTVYGTGTGAVSIEILLLSDLTAGLFQKAIIVSGSVLSPTTITHDPITDGTSLAKTLGVDDEGLDKLKDFYYLPVNKLLNSSYTFLPCVERELPSSHSILDRDPREVFQNKKYHRVPMMIAFTNAEEVSMIDGDDERFQTVPEDFQDLLPHDLAFENHDTKLKVAKLVKDFYFSELGLTVNVLQSYVDFINDVFLEYPVIKTAANYANNGNHVYLMKFMYKGKLNKSKNNIRGASPGDIFTYLSSKEFIDHDEVVAERLVTLWTNFIKLGDPTPLASPLIPEIWPPVTTHSVEGNIILRNIPCLVFNGYIRKEELSGQQYTFWDRIYDKFYSKTFE